jgi:hypothetical protein
MPFEGPKEVKVWGCQVGTVCRMLQHSHTHRWNLCWVCRAVCVCVCGVALSRAMSTCIISHLSCSLWTNTFLRFIQCSTVAGCIDCLSYWEEVHQEDALCNPEDCSHFFFADGTVMNFCWRGGCVLPYHGLRFWLWCDIMYSGLITGDDFVQEHSVGCLVPDNMLWRQSY